MRSTRIDGENSFMDGTSGGAGMRPRDGSGVNLLRPGRATGAGHANPVHPGLPDPVRPGADRLPEAPRLEEDEVPTGPRFEAPERALPEDPPPVDRVEPQRLLGGQRLPRVRVRGAAELVASVGRGPEAPPRVRWVEGGIARPGEKMPPVHEGPEGVGPAGPGRAEPVGEPVVAPDESGLDDQRGARRLERGQG